MMRKLLTLLAVAGLGFALMPFILDLAPSQALMMLRGEYYRDYLLDVIGMMADMDYPLYERVSFGPGQRFAVKGCYIVQVSAGTEPKLERRSDWVSH